MRFVVRLAGAAFCIFSFGACATLAGISDAPNDNGDGTTVLAPSKTGDQRSDANIMILADLKFGDIACGAEMGPRPITIKNIGSTAAAYKVVLPAGTPFRIEGALTGSLDPKNDTVILNVFAKPTTAASTSTDIVVSAGNALQAQTATTHGTGATFELLPPLVSFGQVRMQSGGGPVDVAVKNSGSAPLIVSGFDASNDFTIDLGGGALTVAAGATGTIKASFKGATAESALIHADLKPLISQVLCGPTPTLALEGQRVNSDVSLSGGDFGDVNCSNNPNGKDITISNYSASTISYTATLPNPATSAFQIQSGTETGTIGGGTTATPMTKNVRIQPKPITTTLGTFNDTLTIDIAGIGPPSGGARTVPLKLNAHGAILTMLPPAITDFMSDGTTAQQKGFTVKNTGTDAIVLSWGLQRVSGGDGFSVNGPGSIGPGGGTSNGTVDFKPSTHGDSKAMAYVSVAVLAPICGTPPTLQLEGMRP